MKHFYRIKKESDSDKITFMPQIKNGCFGKWKGIIPAIPYSYFEEKINDVGRFDTIYGGICLKSIDSAKYYIEKMKEQTMIIKKKISYIKS